MTTWVYRFTGNSHFPEPVHEIAALAALDEECEGAWLMLSARADPPGKGAARGDEFLLCADAGNGLRLHGRAIVRGGAELRGEPPAPVRSLYAGNPSRMYLPLLQVELVEPAPVPGLAEEEVHRFTSGQSYVKNLGAGVRRRGASTPVHAIRAPEPPLPVRGQWVAPTGSPLVAAGVDPTAGDWRHAMNRGDAKPMPCVVLEWTGKRFQFKERREHLANQMLWEQVARVGATVVCIDGPCATNGLQLKPDWTGWDLSVPGAMRDGELALHAAGVKLFWTTHATISNFEGASRWIARSLRLFADLEGAPSERIETHPHGAFHVLWRLLGRTDPLPAKSGSAGRKARLWVLQTFIPDIDPAELPDHDAVDAACAALVAGLHGLGLSKSFGTRTNGGSIWMPDANALHVQ
jgi:hypothetical protein